MVVEIELEVGDPLPLERVGQFGCSIQNVGDLVPHEEFLPTGTAVLVPQKQVVQDLSRVEGQVGLHLVLFDPVPALPTLPAALQIPLDFVPR